jgi:molecular chaperone DnaK
VTYSYDENQRIRASVTDVESGRTEEIAITYSGRGVMSHDDLQRHSSYLKQIIIQ